MVGYKKGDKVIFVNKNLGGTKGVVVSQTGEGHRVKIRVKVDGGGEEVTPKNSIAAIGSTKHKKWQNKGATSAKQSRKKRKRDGDSSGEDESEEVEDEDGRMRTTKMTRKMTTRAMMESKREVHISTVLVKIVLN